MQKRLHPSALQVNRSSSIFFHRFRPSSSILDKLILRAFVFVRSFSSIGALDTFFWYTRERIRNVLLSQQINVKRFPLVIPE